MSDVDQWKEHEDACAQHSVTGSGGARFRKIDFHFHTPASGGDYRESSATFDQIAKRLQEEHFDAVFVTDHNEWKGIRPLQNACRQIGAQVSVFPGVELTLTTKAICLLSEGKKINIVKFHCLALLPAGEDFEDKLKSLITDNHKYSQILDQKPVDRVLRQPVEDVSELVRKDWGGLFIPAHLHQDKGIEKSRSIDDLYADSTTIDLLKSYFDAVEIRKPESAAIFSGRYKTPDGLVVPEMTCVLGSDSHDLTSVGREATWVLCEDVVFEEVRQATKHRERLRLIQPSTRYPQIVSLNVDGAFLGHQAFYFSQGITAFIGSKGSGKTAVLELIRFCLGFASTTDEKYLAHLLGPSGKVSLIAKSANDEPFLFSRKAGQPLPQVLSRDGTPVERDSVIPANFNVEIKGWGETTKLAVDVDEQLRLVDNFDQTGSIRRASSDVRQARDDAMGAFTQLRASLTKYRNVKSEAQRLAQRASLLKRLETGRFTERQNQKEQRDSEVALLRGLLKAISARRNEFGLTMLTPEIDAMLGAFERKRIDGASTAPEEAVHIAGQLEALRMSENEFREAAVEGIARLESTIAGGLERIAARNAPLDEEYQLEFAALTLDEQGILTERNRVVQEVSGLDAINAQRTGLWSEVKTLLDRLAADFDGIGNSLSRRSQKRSEIAQHISAVLSQNKVGTKIEFNALSRIKGNLPHGVTAPTAYASLARRYRSLTEDTVTGELSLLEREEMPTELSFSVDDGMTILFEIYADSWKPTTDLSAGQRSTAVLPLVLMAAQGPIILDQPEDNLDNKYIGSAVVSMINERKFRNQMVITSHSASIVVMSDCELIVEMTDEGNKGRAKVAGFLAGPDSAIARSVLDILDGGREALLTRFKKYGKLVQQ